MVWISDTRSVPPAQKKSKPLNLTVEVNRADPGSEDPAGLRGSDQTCHGFGPTVDAVAGFNAECECAYLYILKVSDCDLSLMLCVWADLLIRSC